MAYVEKTSGGCRDHRTCLTLVIRMPYAFAICKSNRRFGHVGPPLSVDRHAGSGR